MCQDNCKEGDVMKDVQTDILIIGSGIAALQSARILGQSFTVHIVTKATVYTSSSYRAQGGIAAVTSLDDHVNNHINDTLEAGVHHHYKQHVDSLVKDGASLIDILIEEGLPIDRLANGSPSLGLEGAHSHHRILHAGGDQTGKMFIEHLLNQLPKTVIIHEQEMAFELLLNSDGACIGARTIKNGEKTNYFAHHTILATGGAGALYECTSNFETNIGDGIALAWRAGVAISDMEFMQFHPSLLFVNGEAKGLVSEAVRGEGGIFVNANHEPIMRGIHPLLDLAPRHITAHTLFTMRMNGEETYIDITNIDNFTDKFPTIAKLCHGNNIDLTTGLIPVTPGSHFLMGGIVADPCGRTTTPHLYAIGEVACTGVHGANRLASNSLLEGITFGQNLAQHLVIAGRNQQNFIMRTVKSKSVLPTLLSKTTLKRQMIKALGIIRNESDMNHFKQQLPTWQQLNACRLDLLTTEQIELIMMHIVARLMVEAALTRTESRGAHIRVDYKDPVPSWAQQWIVFEKGHMKVRNSLYEQHQARQHAKAIF